MRSKFGDNEPQDVSYHGNAFLRLMGYIKPYWKTVALCCVLVGLLTVFDIARPRIIGDAIDKYITQQSAQDLPPETRFQGILIAAGLYVAILLLQFICNRLQYLKIQEESLRASPTTPRRSMTCMPTRLSACSATSSKSSDLPLL